MHFPAVSDACGFVHENRELTHLFYVIHGFFYNGSSSIHPYQNHAFCKVGNMKIAENHHVYVVELSRDVLYESKFKKANPDYQYGKACLYVGMTGLDPDVRFDRHKAGIQANRYVQRFGLRLVPELYEQYNPMPYEDARYMEVDLAIRLREAGYGVWQA